MIGLDRRCPYKIDTCTLMQDGRHYSHAVSLGANGRHVKQLWTILKRSGSLPGQNVQCCGSAVVQSSFKWVRYPPPQSCSVPTLCCVSVGVRACFLYSCYTTTRIRANRRLPNGLSIISGYPKLPLLTSFSSTVFWSIFISKVVSFNSPTCFNRLRWVSNMFWNPYSMQLLCLAPTVHGSDAFPIQNGLLVSVMYASQNNLFLQRR
jgi:hypothetical protein